jgi:hypothetical protein
MKTERVAQIIHWFGLDHSKPQEQINIDLPQPTGSKIILLNGPSGAGKSRLLAHMKNQWTANQTTAQTIKNWIDLADIALPDCAVVDCFPESTLEQTLLSLNRVGLAEAWDYIRAPEALSEGQKFRLKLAVGLARVRQSPRLGRGFPAHNLHALSVLACDEFCAILDRVTARVVARTIRKTIDHQPNVCVIVATSHDDLVEALRPDVLIRCDFGAAEIWEERNIEPRINTNEHEGVNSWSGKGR